VRVFLIDGLRTPTSAKGHYGVNEVKLRNGRIVREGLKTSLSELRLRKASPSARKRWDEICRTSAVFVVGRDRAKLGYFWRHAYRVSRSGRYQGCVVNSDSGAPVYVGEDDERLLACDFKKAKLSELLGTGFGEGTNHARRPLYSALWQADGTKTRRFAPVDFVGRYMADGFFDYAIADEVHELKGDTAQGNALGTLASCARHIAVLTGTSWAVTPTNSLTSCSDLDPPGCLRRASSTVTPGFVLSPKHTACSKRSPSSSRPITPAPKHG
jgi:hypothetical protein